MLAIIEGLSNGIFVIFTGGGQKGGLRGNFKGRA